jgi:hypothetical protein
MCRPQTPKIINIILYDEVLKILSNAADYYGVRELGGRTKDNVLRSILRMSRDRFAYVYMAARTASERLPRV